MNKSITVHAETVVCRPLYCNDIYIQSNFLKALSGLALTFDNYNFLVCVFKKMQEQKVP